MVQGGGQEGVPGHEHGDEVGAGLELVLIGLGRQLAHVGLHAGGGAQRHGLGLGFLVAVGLVGEGQRHLGVDDKHAAAGQFDDEIGTLLAALVRGRGVLLLEVEAAGHAGGFQNIAAGLLAPAAATAGVALQGLGQAARLVAGGGRGGHQGGQLLLQPAGVLGAGLLQRRDVLLELGQGFGDRLELGLHPLARDAVLGLEGLGGAGHQLGRHGLGGLRGLGLEELGHGIAALLHQLQPGVGGVERPLGLLPAHEGPEEAGDSGDGDDQQDEFERVHAPFLAGVAGG
ncbi:hypothetical protein D3C81_1393150 [compost metagenome]